MKKKKLAKRHIVRLWGKMEKILPELFGVNKTVVVNAKVAFADTRDDGDRSQANIFVNLSITLASKNAKLVAAIDRAFLRMEKGVYGECSECEDLITIKRLNVVPWASLCIVCKERQKEGDQEETRPQGKFLSLGLRQFYDRIEDREKRKKKP